ncbi:coronatine-insensitive 1, partial [Tanacetum coccineum]
MVIETFHFGYPFDIYDIKDVTLLAKNCCNSLVSLKIGPCMLKEIREAFRQAVRLEDFSRAYTDEDEDYVGQFCKKLCKFIHYGRVTDIGLTDLAQGCYNLEYLDVNLLDISNEVMECIGTHLKNLRDLRMDLVKDCMDLPLDNGIRAMLTGCNKLERLDIHLFHGGLTDVGLGYIGKYGRNLVYLSLKCIGESDAGLVDVSKGCPKLGKL